MTSTPQPASAEPIELSAAAYADPASRADWEALAAGVLRKAGRMAEAEDDSRVWGLLARTTLDGIAVTPLGVPEDRDGVAARPDRAGAWDIRAHVVQPDPAAAAAEIAVDLDNGVTSLWLQVGDDALPVAGLGTALAGVLLDVAPISLSASGTVDDQIAAARALLDVLGDTTPAAGTNLGIDPLGAAVRGGTTSADDLVETVRTAVGVAGSVTPLVVDATALHDLGASDVQELAWSLAAGAAYLRALEAVGVEATRAAGLVDFRFAASAEQFPTIAKLRAARQLWARVLELSGVPAERRSQVQHAVTSRPMMTKYDPWVNMLRTCVAAFAAGVGGADAVTVLPFDSRLGLPDAFGRRIARNTSSLLIHESHLARVSDPAGGAYAVERLTGEVAAAAWAEFGLVEEAGGALAAWLDGSVRSRVDEVAATRDDQVARRQRPITGLSEFPNLAETLPERAPYAAGARETRPYGHAFEALRDAPAAAPVFLATMGTVAAHTARATFAANLFAAGGIETVNEGRHDDTDAVLAHYRGETVVCLVGSDAAYAAWGADLVTALREAGARRIIVAGSPTDPTAEVFAEADDACATGIDALDFLTRTRDQLTSDGGTS